MAKTTEISIYELIKDWFDFCFENPDLINPNHGAMYFFILEHNNRLGWKQKFGLPMQMTMDAIGIKNNRTYTKAFNDLIDWGFIVLHQKSKNQYSANIIAIVKNTRATTKALSKATHKHSQKQRTGIAHIDIPITNIPITNLQERERETPPPQNTFNNFKNKMELDLDSCFENVMENELYLETISMNNHFANIEITKQWIRLFYKKLQNEGVTEKSINDFKSHFARWLNIEIINKNGTKTGKHNQSIDTEEGQRDLINAVATGIARAEYERNLTVSG